MNIEEKSNFLKREIKDIIFHEAFSTQENLPAIYKSFHPEDENEYFPEDFIITNLNSVITNGLRNDLSFLNLRTNVLMFIEAESSWKISHLKRYGKYVISILAEIFNKYENLKDIDFPTVEFFVLDTSSQVKSQKTYRIFDAFNRDYVDGKDIGNFLVNIINRKNDNVPLDTIVDILYTFCELQLKICRKYGRNRKAARILVEVCIEKNIFADYFKSYKEEVVSYLEKLFDQERIDEMNRKESFDSGFNSGFDSGFGSGFDSGFGSGYDKGNQETADQAYIVALESGASEDLAREIRSKLLKNK